MSWHPVWRFYPKKTLICQRLSSAGQDAIKAAIKALTQTHNKQTE
jgi:hypothetical protein